MFENLVRCPNCGAMCGFPEWGARKTVLWANQSGWKYRVFCKVCGETSDVTMLHRTQSYPPTAKSFAMSYRRLPKGTAIQRYDAIISYATPEEILDMLF
jgi:hypothetical protein